MENLKNKNLWIGLAVGLVVILGLMFWANNSSAPAPVVNNNPVIIPTEDTTSGSVHTSSAPVLTYTEALTKYKDARLQLDMNCQALASPSNLTFKNNSSIMVDNRAPVARTVKVGSVFNVKAYGFKIVKLSSAQLPATWFVDCGVSKNVATITIQK